MKKALYFGGVLVILLVNAILLNACHVFGNSCYYDKAEETGGQAPVTNPCHLTLPPGYDFEVINLGSTTTPANFNINTFVNLIKEEMSGTVKGWQLGVGYEGRVLRLESGGVRTGKWDCPSNLPMTACTKTRIGSQTKMYSAVAIISLLLEGGKDPFTEPIGDYLPSSWKDNLSEAVTDLPFANYLGHRTGFGPGDVKSTLRAGVKEWLERPKTGNTSKRRYHNGNYGLMRIVFPKVYCMAKNIPYNESDYDTDEECSELMIQYLEDEFLHPLGNYFDIIKWSENNGSEVLAFENAKDRRGYSKDYSIFSAGNMAVSAQDMVRFYMELFDGKKNIISPNVIDQMRNKAFVIGLNNFTNTAGPMNELYFGHGGTLPIKVPQFEGGYYSYTLYMPGGLVVSLAVNSCWEGHPVVGDKCKSTGASGILVNAFNRSF